MNQSPGRTFVILTGAIGRDDLHRISDAVGRMSPADGVEVELIGATERYRRADLLAFQRIEYGPTGLDHLGDLARPHRRLRAIADGLDASGHRTSVRALPPRLVIDEAIATLDDARRSGQAVGVIVQQSAGWAGRRRSGRLTRGIRELGFAPAGAQVAGGRRSVLLEFSIPGPSTATAARCAAQRDWRDHPLRSELDGAGGPWSMSASRGVKTHRPDPRPYARPEPLTPPGR